MDVGAGSSSRADTYGANIGQPASAAFTLSGRNG